MAVVLAPWPAEDGTALDEARAGLSGAAGIVSDDYELLDRLGSTAGVLVERYAPDAPQSSKNEAVIRTVGWLLEQPSAAVRSLKVGDVERAFATTAMSALRHSGGMALLSPFKIRRAGAI